MLELIRQMQSKPRHEPSAPEESAAVNARGLERELQRKLRGEVRFDDGSRALYATDASNYRQVPIGVVVPRDLDDVILAVETAREFGAPILSRGGGTSLAGQCCNAAVVMDFSKYVNRVLEIDADRKLATVEPGCVLDHLQHQAARFGLTFGPDPATHTHCTLGGMLGNNSCGVHSLLSANAGLGMRTSDNTHELVVLTYEGHELRVGATTDEDLQRFIDGGGARSQIYSRLKALRDRYADEIHRRTPNLPRRVSGYNLDELLPENGFHVARGLVGSEGTLVTILQSTLHLVPLPAERVLLVLGYPDIYVACDHLTRILDFRPSGLEGLDRRLMKWVRAAGSQAEGVELFPEGGGFLLVEFGGQSLDEARDKAHRCIAELRRDGKGPHAKILEDRHEQTLVWEVRESGLGSTAWVPGHPDTWEGWEDSAVPPENLADYLRELRQLLDRYDYHPSLYGHFGQGCIHTRIAFDLYTAAGISKWRSFMDEAANLVLSFGGSLSGEHGDGQARGELLDKQFGPRLVEAFREYKRIWDPQWKMNPGKVVDPYPITQNLRISPQYDPPAVATHFHYPDDEGSFDRAVLRCVGVGECRRHDGGVMCPSYMATGEEMHSTRGRARLLWEMLNGELRHEGWRSEHVKEALDLCLSCKGCKTECPVNVDMATYKAEFNAHYYAGRLRPRQAYVFGWIYWWSRLASLAPGVANFFSQTPVLRDIAKVAAGIAPQRQLPPFARETFRDWFERRQRERSSAAKQNLPLPPGKGRGESHRATTARHVVLWPDTFNNHLHPEVAKAAVEVLEHAGYHVRIPPRSLCCGRPLYEFGMIPAARRLLRQVMDTLRPEIEAGALIVGLEPSCVAVFRDELPNLFPGDELAKRLHEQAFLLSELLNRHTADYQPPQLHRRALFHPHCHHRSIMGIDDEIELLTKMGLELEQPDSGCCGMAGPFGFEAGEHYRVAMACGERALLPAVRQADAETLIIADGFSCQEQVAQATARRPLHVAQVLQMALHEGRDTSQPFPERHYPLVEPARLHPAWPAALATMGLLAIGGLWLFSRRNLLDKC